VNYHLLENGIVPEVAGALRLLWEGGAIKHTYGRRNEFYLLDSAK
jgi:hypothetical protein